MMVVTPALAAIGIDVNKLTFSCSTLMETRTTSRESLAIAVRKNFQPLVPLVAHFDGKMLSNVVRTKCECLSIIVSGLDIEKLLGIPQIPAGTGALMGQKVVELIHEWPDIEAHLAGLFFDTTASNPGSHNGEITVIQKSMNQRVLFLACRHHNLEICANAVFDAFFISKGLNIELLRVKSKFEPLESDKIFGFCHQLNITEKEIGILRRICLFITTIYACFWFSAPLTIAIVKLTAKL